MVALHTKTFQNLLEFYLILPPITKHWEHCIPLQKPLVLQYCPSEQSSLIEHSKTYIRNYKKLYLLNPYQQLML